MEELRRIRPCEPPPDFADHWRERYARALHLDPAPRLAPAFRHGAHEVHTITFNTTGGRRLGGWVALPRRRRIRRGIVQSHGYAGRGGIDDSFLDPDMAVLWPVARGLPVPSTTGDLPSDPQQHVLVGIEDRDNYILGGCTEDIWCAATALEQIAGKVPLGFVGDSFGGGTGALALPWDDRFAVGVLQVPSFGQYDVRLRTPCVGSGEAVRLYVRGHPQAREVLRYFDASSAACSIDIPMLVGCALQDPAVPEAGQWAVRNAIEHAEEFVLTAGHMSYPGERAELREWVRRRRRFLRKHLPSA